MLDLIVIDGRARGIVVRDMVTGAIETHIADAVVLGTGGYGNVFFLSTNAMGCNTTAIWRSHRKGALFGNPCFTQIHPTCIPVSGEHQSKLTLMSESLRNDGRVWVPLKRGDDRPPDQIPEAERDYYLERRYPVLRQPRAPRRRVTRRQAVCDEGRGVGPGGLGVYLDFADCDQPPRRGDDHASATTTCSRCTSASPTRTRTSSRCASTPPSTTRWVASGLTTTCMSSIPGLFVGRRGELLRSRRQPSRRLGSDAGPGRRLLRAAVDRRRLPRADAGQHRRRDAPRGVRSGRATSTTASSKLLSTNGTRTVDSFHRELGKIMWDYCGMGRTEEGLRKALDRIPELREEFWQSVEVLGTNEELNQ